MSLSYLGKLSNPDNQNKMVMGHVTSKIGLSCVDIIKMLAACHHVFTS